MKHPWQMLSRGTRVYHRGTRRVPRGYPGVHRGVHRGYPDGGTPGYPVVPRGYPGVHRSTPGTPGVHAGVLRGIRMYPRGIRCTRGYPRGIRGTRAYLRVPHPRFTLPPKYPHPRFTLPTKYPHPHLKLPPKYPRPPKLKLESKCRDLFSQLQLQLQLQLQFTPRKTNNGLRPSTKVLSHYSMLMYLLETFYFPHSTRRNASPALCPEHANI